MLFQVFLWMLPCFATANRKRSQPRLHKNTAGGWTPKPAKKKFRHIFPDPAQLAGTGAETQGKSEKFLRLAPGPGGGCDGYDCQLINFAAIGPYSISARGNRGLIRFVKTAVIIPTPCRGAERRTPPTSGQHPHKTQQPVPGARVLLGGNAGAKGAARRSRSVDITPAS